MNTLAFDLGASSGKLFLGSFDGEKLTLSPVHRFENGPVQVGGGLYWDFINIYRNMQESIALAAQQTGGRIDSFGVDTFSNDFGFIDQSGLLLAPLFCYRDARTARCRDDIFARMAPEELYRRTGNQIALFNAVMQLAAMRLEHKNLLLDNAHKLLFLPDLLLYYLTGEMACEYTIASVSQMYSYEKQGWDKEILERFDIPAGLLAGIQMPGTVRGQLLPGLAKQAGCNPFDVVSVCQHDTGSAFLAALGGADSAILSSGTWAIAGAENDAPIISDFGRAHNIANEGGYAHHHRLLCSLMGNWILQELRRELHQQGQSLSFADMETLAAAETPFAFLIDVDDECFFAPGDMAAKIQQRCKEHYGAAPETVGGMVRCVCESLALKCLWTVEKIEHLLGRPLQVISVIGGGCKDKLTCQLLADAAQRPVLAGPADASALGNIMVQLMAKGELASVEQGRELLRRSMPPRTHTPGKAGGWAEVYEAFKVRFDLQL